MLAQFRESWEHLPTAKQQLIVAMPSLGLLLNAVFDWPLEKWSLLLGMLFVSVQFFYLIWKWRRDVRIEAERVRARAWAPTQAEE